MQGNDAEFRCNSNNSVTVTWLHDNGANEPFMVGRVVKSKFGYKYAVMRDGTYNVLTVKNVSLSDSETYSCIYNIGLEAQLSAVLVVLGE